MAKTPYSPADEIAKYNKIVKDRGYDFFSSQAIRAHENKYGEKPTGQIVSDAKEMHADFMKACTDINHRDHAEAHDTLMKKYGGDRKAALAGITHDEMEKNGRLPEQYPMRNTHYENQTLKEQQPGKSASAVEHNLFGALRQVLQAKWKAVGYEGDGQEILRFNMDYAHSAV